jgi:ribulose-phosphate 3-epimerase
MKKVSPSMLSSDFSDLKNDLKSVCDYADYLHIDVMDGVFVNNISFGIPVMKSIRPLFDITFDTHLMIINPLKYIDAFKDAGADIITFHIEANDDPNEVVKKIHDVGLKAGISINPPTDIHQLDPYLSLVDLVLVMSVNPGFGGQKFDPVALDKIRYLAEVRKEKGYHYEIEVDGGINNETGKLCKECGVDVLVSGSYIFKAKNREEVINDLKA